MQRRPIKKLTPFQQMEHEIRESKDGEMDTGPTPRAGDEVDSNINLTDRARTAGLTEASLPGSGPTDDDMAPETLIHEDGALSPAEAGEDVPADRTYRVVTAKEIGVGYGLDEAELAHVDPLDGEPWDDENDVEDEPR